VNLDVIGVAVSAGGVVADEDVGVLLAQQGCEPPRRDLRGQLAETLAERVGAVHAGVGIAEDLQALAPERLC